MEKSILGVFLIISSINLAQNNTLPNTENVGIGTLNPSTRLQVNGNVKVDSCLIISDSAIIQKNARIGEDLKIEGQLYLPNVLDVPNTTDRKWAIIDSQGKIERINKV